MKRPPHENVATVLVETGMVPVIEPETVVRIETPAGLVTARVAVSDGKATSVTLENVSIVSQGVGIDALRSDVRATDLRVDAAVGVRASGSLLDLAATRIVARERALELPRPSWVYFSVSEIDAPDYKGDAHLAWPVTMTRKR